MQDSRNRALTVLATSVLSVRVGRRHWWAAGRITMPIVFSLQPLLLWVALTSSLAP